MAVLDRLKSKAYWNGVVVAVAWPLLGDLVASTENTLDDTVYTMAKGFLDQVLPPVDPPALPPAA